MSAKTKEGAASRKGAPRPLVSGRASATSRPSGARRVKTGGRSAKEFENILEASTRLLTSKGLAAFTTNAVAALAGVDLPTLYSHFTDRTAILLELFERSVNSRQAIVLDALENFAESDDPIAWIRKHVDLFSQLRYANSADIVLRRSVRAIPELFEVEARSNNAYVNALDRVLRKKLPKLDARRSRGVSRAIVESCTALLDYGAMNPKDAQQMSEEMALLVIGYLREVITRYS